MTTRKTTRRERELELRRGGTRKNRLAIMSAVIVVAAVLPVVLFNTVLANHRPAITTLETDAPQTIPLGSLQVTCHAVDPDGDVLSYEWTTTGGDITGTGPEVTWTAPQDAGTYNVTVVVNDGHGGNARKTTDLTVSSPVIEGLNVTAKEPKYLKETSTGYKVGKTKEYDIECVASGTGTLGYDWTSTGGQISGEGSVVTWTAPDTTSDVTVTVTVSDGAGNWGQTSMVFEVVDCSPCTFG